MQNKNTYKKLSPGEPIEGYLKQIVQIMEEHFKGRGMHIEVYVYGSRARGTEHAASDIDLTVKSSEELTYELSHINEALHESTIPYKVDCVDWKRAGKELKQNIDNEGILIWKN